MLACEADIYMQGTATSKKKKEKKLKRVMAAVKRQQRRTKRTHENFAAIQLIYDPQARPYAADLHLD